MDAIGQIGTEQAGHPAVEHGIVAVTVSYLPSPNPFHQKFPDETVIGTVRADAMKFFGVSDRRDRDIHEFFLEFEGRRLTNMGEKLAQLLGPCRHEAHFHLVEQVTKGSI